MNFKSPSGDASRLGRLAQVGRHLFSRTFRYATPDASNDRLSAPNGALVTTLWFDHRSGLVDALDALAALDAERPDCEYNTSEAVLDAVDWIFHMPIWDPLEPGDSVGNLFWDLAEADLVAAAVTSVNQLLARRPGWPFVTALEPTDGDLVHDAGTSARRASGQMRTRPVRM